MLKGIVKGVAGLNKNNFESIFKKYCYYIEKIPTSDRYHQAQLHEKILFLDAATEVYFRMGKLKTNHMVKAFNKVSDELLNTLVQQYKNNSND